MSRASRLAVRAASFAAATAVLALAAATRSPSPLMGEGRGEGEASATAPSPYPLPQGEREQTQHTGAPDCSQSVPRGYAARLDKQTVAPALALPATSASEPAAASEYPRPGKPAGPHESEAPAPAAPPRVFPGKTWQERPPAEVGLDAAGLRALAEFLGGRGCVVRHGYLVFAWGDASKRGDVASAAKPIYAHFFLKAFEDGKITGLDEPVVRWEPRLAALNADLGHKDRGITWRHLANQTSCYGVAEPPGTAFDYNDWQMSLFWDTLFLKVYGATCENVDAAVLRPLLADAIGCQDAPTLMAFGTKDRPGRLAISCRDFARFGLLYLAKGNWNGRQLLRRDLAEMAVASPLPNRIPQTAGKEAAMLPGQRTMGSRHVPDNQTDHLGSYSWLWWTNGVDRDGRRHWPDVPTDTFGAFGHGGKRAMVALPGLDLIIAWNDAGPSGRDDENAALARLVASARSPSPSMGEGRGEGEAPATAPSPYPLPPGERETTEPVASP